MAHIQPLCPQLQKVAIEELGELPARIPEDLLALKEWIKQQPHLNARTDDQFLIQFLRGCKYSLERAKEKIDKFFALKSKYPDLFSPTNVDDKEFRAKHNLGCIVPLPTPLNDHGPRIFIFRFNYNAPKETMEDICLPLNAMQEIVLMNDPYAAIEGVIYITDLAKLSASHLLQITPSFLKRILMFYEKSVPLRIKNIFYINVPGGVEQFFNMVLSCMSDKLRKRVIICGKDMKKLLNVIPLKYLPKDYGGENGSLDQLVADYNKVWDEQREYFKENAHYGTNESLRLGSPMDFDGLVGVGGTFRKLVVD